MSEMANKSKIEKSLDQEYLLLDLTAQFLVSKVNDKVAELDKIKSQLENNWDEQLQSDFEQKCLELNSLNNKMNWEQARVNDFEKKIENLQNHDEQKLIESLSKKIIKPFIKKKKNKDNKE